MYTPLTIHNMALITEVCKLMCISMHCNFYAFALCKGSRKHLAEQAVVAFAIQRSNVSIMHPIVFTIATFYPRLLRMKMQMKCFEPHLYHHYYQQ